MSPNGTKQSVRYLACRHNPRLCRDRDIARCPGLPVRHRHHRAGAGDCRTGGPYPSRRGVFFFIPATRDAGLALAFIAPSIYAGLLTEAWPIPAHLRPAKPGTGSPRAPRRCWPCHRARFPLVGADAIERGTRLLRYLHPWPPSSRPAAKRSASITPRSRSHRCRRS